MTFLEILEQIEIIDDCNMKIGNHFRNDYDESLCANRFFGMISQISDSVDSCVGVYLHYMDDMMEAFVNRKIISEVEYAKYCDQRKDM